MASKLGEDTAERDEILLTNSAAKTIRETCPAVRFSGERTLSVGGKPYLYYAYDGGCSTE